MFYLVLLALFIVGLGFSLQQTAANPFVISLGDIDNGSQRLNLAGGVNSLGTTIGPIVIALIIFGSTPLTGDELNQMILNNQIKLTTIQYLYLVVGFLFLAAAALFYFSRKLPNTKTEATFEPAKRAKNTLILLTLIIIICFGVIFKSYTTSENAVSDAVENTRLTLLIIALLAVVGCLIYANMKASKKAEGWGAMKYPQLVLGMLAIFTYVGVEVTIQSNLGELLKSVSDKVNNLNPLRTQSHERC